MIVQHSHIHEPVFVNNNLGFVMFCQFNCNLLLPNGVGKHLNNWPFVLVDDLLYALNALFLRFSLSFFLLVWGSRKWGHSKCYRESTRPLGSSNWHLHWTEGDWSSTISETIAYLQYVKCFRNTLWTGSWQTPKCGWRPSRPLYRLILIPSKNNLIKFQSVFLVGLKGMDTILNSRKFHG